LPSVESGRALTLDDLKKSPNPLARRYSRFRVAERLLLPGHSHQAWPDIGFEGQAEAWEDAVRTTVCLGGDTDTLACIAGAVAEVIHGLPRDIADSARAYLTDDLRVVLERFEAAVRA